MKKAGMFPQGFGGLVQISAKALVKAKALAERGAQSVDAEQRNAHAFPELLFSLASSENEDLTHMDKVRQDAGEPKKGEGDVTAVEPKTNVPLEMHAPQPFASLSTMLQCRSVAPETLGDKVEPPLQQRMDILLPAKGTKIPLMAILEESSSPAPPFAEGRISSGPPAPLKAKIKVESAETHIAPAQQPAALLPSLDEGSAPPRGQGLRQSDEPSPRLSPALNRGEALRLPDVAPASTLPTAPASPVQQIADRITIALAVPEGSSAPQTVPGPNGQESSAGAAVKVLRLKLEPPELGELTVHLSLKRDALHLRLEAVRHETVSLIQRDQETLTGLLQSAGYLVDGMAMQITDMDKSGAASGSPSLQGQGFGPSATPSQPGGAHSGGRSGGWPQAAREQSQEPQKPNEILDDKPNAHPSGGLYV